jgi:hypothetical protein
MGLMGGVEAQMITSDVARISARGNAYTDKARIADFVLLKAAQSALAHGFSHFAIMNVADATQSGVTIGKYTGVNTYVKPGEDVLVHFCRGECSGMLSAREIVNNLGPTYLTPPTG